MVLVGLLVSRILVRTRTKKAIINRIPTIVSAEPWCRGGKFVSGGLRVRLLRVRYPDFPQACYSHFSGMVTVPLHSTTTRDGTSWVAMLARQIPYGPVPAHGETASHLSLCEWRREQLRLWRKRYGQSCAGRLTVGLALPSIFTGHR